MLALILLAHRACKTNLKLFSEEKHCIIVYIEILRENLNSVSCIKACIDYLYVDHAVNAAEYCKILHLKPQRTGNVIKNKQNRSCAMDFVPFLNPCMLIQTIGEKKKKGKKKLVYYQNLIKESKAAPW